MKKIILFCLTVLLSLNANASLLRVESLESVTTSLGVYYPGGYNAPGNYFGTYNVSVNGKTWTSLCLSPGGVVHNWSEPVVEKSFEEASPGHLPSKWSNGGIYNAAYLYNAYIDASKGNVDKGVGLALAILDALYDSDGLGKMSNGKGLGRNNGLFFADYVNSEQLKYYNQYISEINEQNINSHNYHIGSIFRPANPDGTVYNGGQDFITRSIPVPETSTFIAGLLLLLPFSVSTFRVIRKNRR